MPFCDNFKQFTGQRLLDNMACGHAQYSKINDKSTTLCREPCDHFHYDILFQKGEKMDKLSEEARQLFKILKSILDGRFGQLNDKILARDTYLSMLKTTQEDNETTVTVTVDKVVQQIKTILMGGGEKSWRSHDVRLRFSWNSNSDVVVSRREKLVVTRLDLFLAIAGASSFFLGSTLSIIVEIVDAAVVTVSNDVSGKRQNSKTDNNATEFNENKEFAAGLKKSSINNCKHKETLV